MSAEVFCGWEETHGPHGYARDRHDYDCPGGLFPPDEAFTAEELATSPETAQERLRMAVIGAQRAGLAPDAVMAAVAPLWAAEGRDEASAEPFTPFVAWLTEWLEANLTYETFKGIPDEDIAAKLVNDMAEAHWTVFKTMRVRVTR